MLIVPGSGHLLVQCLDTEMCSLQQDAFPTDLLPQNMFQRAATVLVYLNDVQEAGPWRFLPPNAVDHNRKFSFCLRKAPSHHGYNTPLV